MNIEKLRDLERKGVAKILETAHEGTCQLWRVNTDEPSEYVVLPDNTVLTREEDMDDESPTFPLKSQEELEIESAKATLEKYGYFTRNLWTTDDVTERFNCTTEQALDVLESVLHNEYIVNEMNIAIDDVCEERGFERTEDDNFPE